jgi:hypothetical protein
MRVWWLLRVSSFAGGAGYGVWVDEFTGRWAWAGQLSL